jgi:hypothetical protein
MNGYQQENVFETEQPETYWCQLWWYAVGHSNLTIQVNKQSSVFYLHFSGVKYLSLPQLWEDANFKIAPLEACVEIIQAVSQFNVDHFLSIFPPQEFPWKLYTVDHPKTSIKIVALTASKTDTQEG